MTESANSGCGFDGCERKHYANGLCNAHDQQRRKGRDLAPVRRVVRGSVADRIRARTKPVDGCWVWTGALDPNGYGFIRVRGKTMRSHRASYEAFVGPIPDLLSIDHLCRNRACANPEHLEPVTTGENIRRGLKTYTLRTECAKGHDISDPRNVKTRNDGRRECRLCARASFHRVVPSQRR